MPLTATATIATDHSIKSQTRHQQNKHFFSMRKTIICLLLFAISTMAMAQAKKDKYLKSHLGAGINAGIARVLTMPNANTVGGFSFGIDVEYEYFFFRHLGIRSGICFNHSSSSLKEENIATVVSRDTRITTNSGPRTIRTNNIFTLDEVNERYSMTFVEIPLMIVLQGNPIDFTIDRFRTFHLAAGVKMNLPLAVMAYPDYTPSHVVMGPRLSGVGVTLDRNMPLDDYQGTTGEYSMSAAGNMLYLMGAIEAGATINFNSGGALSIALFADYAINSSSIEWDKRPLITAGDNQLSTQGYLDSDKLERFKYYKIGIKLQYNIFW